jgi:hypothetical protein
LFSSVAAGMFGALVLFVPLPRAVEAPATIRPDLAGATYVTVPGRLVSAVRAGTQVQRGDPLVVLRNDDIEFEITRLSADVAEARQQLERLRRQQVQDPRTGLASAAAQRTVWEQSLLDLERQLERRIAEREQLVVRAPADGTLIAPPARRATGSEFQLDVWTGTPLDACNVGCTLETGTIVGFVGDPGYREVLALIEPSNIDDVQPGLTAALQLDELAGRSLRAEVSDVATVSTWEPPEEFVAKHQLAAQQSTDGSLQLLEPRFPIRVMLSEQAPAPFGASGWIRIRVEPRTIAQRLYDAFCRTFRSRG